MCAHNIHMYVCTTTFRIVRKTEEHTQKWKLYNKTMATATAMLNAFLTMLNKNKIERNKKEKQRVSFGTSSFFCCCCLCMYACWYLCIFASLLSILDLLLFAFFSLGTKPNANHLTKLINITKHRSTDIHTDTCLHTTPKKKARRAVELQQHK